MAARQNALSELVRFWLEACRGCLLRESVPVPVPYNQSDIDFVALRPDLQKFLLPTGESVGPRLIVESKDEHDFDPSGRDFGKRLLDDGTFNVVMSTWTLCSIPEVNRALAEVHRVLMPGGRFVLLEHGLGGDPGVQRWQRRLNPIQRVLGDAGQNPVVHGTQRIDIMRWESARSQFNGGHQCRKPNATCWTDRFPQTLQPC